MTPAPIGNLSFGSQIADDDIGFHPRAADEAARHAGHAEATRTLLMAPTARNTFAPPSGRPESLTPVEFKYIRVPTQGRGNDI